MTRPHSPASLTRAPALLELQKTRADGVELGHSPKSDGAPEEQMHRRSLPASARSPTVRGGPQRPAHPLCGVRRCRKVFIACLSLHTLLPTSYHASTVSWALASLLLPTIGKDKSQSFVQSCFALHLLGPEVPATLTHPALV